jgi:hypothetical protein
MDRDFRIKGIKECQLITQTASINNQAKYTRPQWKVLENLILLRVTKHLKMLIMQIKSLKVTLPNTQPHKVCPPK